MIGVYKITNTVNGKVYIGSTTTDLEKRWSCHRSALRSGKHFNYHLQQAWNKYGEQAFTFEVVEEAQDKQDARAKELSWIARLFGKNCYNATTQAAGRPSGNQLTDIEAYVKDALNCGCVGVRDVHEYIKNNTGVSIKSHAIYRIFQQLGYQPSEVVFGKRKDWSRRKP